MSVEASVGSERNLLDETPEHARQLVIANPILLDEELERLRQIDSDVFRRTRSTRPGRSRTGRRASSAPSSGSAPRRTRRSPRGANILVLSDRAVGPERAPIPSLLAVSAVHHHLVREGTRLQAGLIVESGEPRSVHSVAVLVGYGAAAVNPYLMLETLAELVDLGWLPPGMTTEDAQRRAIKGIAKGLLKTISKMGISTIPSYCGAQIFEAVGLAPSSSSGTSPARRRGSAGSGSRRSRRDALAPRPRLPGHRDGLLPVTGLYAWRRDGEHHQWNPETIALLQHAVRHGGFGTYEEYAQAVNDDSARRSTLRGLLRFRFADGRRRPARRGRARERDREALRDRRDVARLALARGARDARDRDEPDRRPLEHRRGRRGPGALHPRRERRLAALGDQAGRLGPLRRERDYLANADELQIKMAQGAKPGEGGQLPGHKVDRYIASVRLTTPGVGLISPPPHHDIYSIEDLKQLIYDLRCANPEARISVKLVAEVGVGTVAAGVAKANADHVLISGHDGGTGASPLSSILFAGVPWEIGLAETQQTLVLNDLRSRIWVQTDGQLKTGRDVVVAALLGADEMGFATAPLIATGCVMMRACHLNTCPVGIATQDPELRARFPGQPEHVVNFLFFVAEEARRIMARLGVGAASRTSSAASTCSRPTTRSSTGGRAGSTSRRSCMPPDVPPGAAARRTEPQASPLGGALDWTLIEAARPALERGAPVEPALPDPQRQPHRRRPPLARGHEGARRGRAPPGTIRFTLHGSAGQSFGAWLAPGIELDARRRRERLRRQGPLRRRARRPAARGAPASPPRRT